MCCSIVCFYFSSFEAGIAIYFKIADVQLKKFLGFINNLEDGSVQNESTLFGISDFYKILQLFLSGLLTTAKFQWVFQKLDYLTCNTILIDAKCLENRAYKVSWNRLRIDQVINEN